MTAFPDDIYTEPSDVDVDALRDLGPLRDGIRSTPFLDYAFRTVEFRIKVTVNPDGTWTYDEDTVLMIRDQAEPFHHTDRSVFTRIADPTANPLARK